MAEDSVKTESVETETAEVKEEQTTPQEEKASKSKQKPQKESATEKKAKKADAKKKAQLKKEWADSIITSKRVKREEKRSKLKQAMLILLVSTLIITSIVYVMLLFVNENNVRITASSGDVGQSISLSMDNELWTPFLNCDGPSEMKDISYNPIYSRPDPLKGGIPVPTIESAQQLLLAEEPTLGAVSTDEYIAFMFMLRNDSNADVKVQASMYLDYNDKGLEKAIRVMWGTAFRNSAETNVKVFAALSDNQRLDGTNINVGRTAEDGYIEYIAYPVGSDRPSYSLTDYEQDLQGSASAEAKIAGYRATTPFYSDEYVFHYADDNPNDDGKPIVVKQGDIMYCYLAIWIEGSDFECVDRVLGGYVKMGIDFVAVM